MLVLHESKSGLVEQTWAGAESVLVKRQSRGKGNGIGMWISRNNAKCSFNLGAKYSSVTLLILLRSVMDISLDKWEDGGDSSFLMLCTIADLSLS